METLYWDKEEALGRFSNSEETLKHLVHVFIECMPKFLENLQKSIDTKELSAIAFNAHSIKGSSANIGAKEIQRVTREIELLAKYSPTSIESIIDLKNELLDIWQKSMNIFKEYIHSIEENSSIEFSKEIFCRELQILKEGLVHGEFIDSETNVVFHTKVDQELSLKIKRLEYCVDTFKKEEAFSVIDSILNKVCL